MKTSSPWFLRGSPKTLPKHSEEYWIDFLTHSKVGMSGNGEGISNAFHFDDGELNGAGVSHPSGEPETSWDGGCVECF